MSYYKRLVNANKRATVKCMSISLPAMIKVQGKGKKQCDDVKFPTNVHMQTAVTDEKKKKQRKSIRFPKADLAAHLKESVPEAQCENEAAILALIEKHSAKTTDYKVVNDALANSTNYDSLLHLAASKNYLKLALYLFSHSMCELERRDRRGHTALQTAIQHKNVDVMRLLLQGGASMH